jgi:hypothetical protein
MQGCPTLPLQIGVFNNGDLNSLQSPPIHWDRKKILFKAGNDSLVAPRGAPLTTSSDSVCSSLAISFLSLMVYGSLRPLLHLPHPLFHLPSLPRFSLLPIFLASHDLPCFSQSRHSSRSTVRHELHRQSDMHGHGKEPRACMKRCHDMLMVSRIHRPT